VVHILDNTDKNRANIENKKYKEEALVRKKKNSKRKIERKALNETEEPGSAQ